MTTADLPGVTPEEASRNGVGQVRDEDLPMLAAIWLARGYDSGELRELAGLTREEARQGGRRLVAGVLASLGWPVRDWRNAPEEIPWLGCWYQVEYAQDQMDRLLTPYAAAQRVVEVASDVPDLWVPAGGARLTALLEDWDRHLADRSRINDQIREHVRALREQDVPPLISRS